MNLGALVSLILRANKAGRPPVEPWQQGSDDQGEVDAKRFISQLARMLPPEHANEIQRLAFPPGVRIQVWCDTYGCEFAKIAMVSRAALGQPGGACPKCGVAIHYAVVHPFIYKHPNLFDVWTLEAPSLEAAEEKFATVWDERTREGGEYSHLTSSTFDQGEVITQEDYEAP